MLVDPRLLASRIDWPRTATLYVDPERFAGFFDTVHVHFCKSDNDLCDPRRVCFHRGSPESGGSYPPILEAPGSLLADPALPADFRSAGKDLETPPLHLQVHARPLKVGSESLRTGLTAQAPKVTS